MAASAPMVPDPLLTRGPPTSPSARAVPGPGPHVMNEHWSERGGSAQRVPEGQRESLHDRRSEPGGDGPKSRRRHTPHVTAEGTLTSRSLKATREAAAIAREGLRGGTVACPGVIVKTNVTNVTKLEYLNGKH